MDAKLHTVNLAEHSTDRWEIFVKIEDNIECPKYTDSRCLPGREKPNNVE